MDDYLRKDFGKILKSAGLEARRWMKLTDSTASRVYDRNLEELPVTVDLYGEWARIVDYSDEEMQDEEKGEIEDIVSRFLYVEKDKIVSLWRRKREGKEQYGTNDGECRIKIRENGLLFECELKKYTDTGLFLDMSLSRAMVREMARNQRVLNLFSYTSSFSVYAASGLCESVTGVDLSNVYSQWGRRNLDANGFLDSEKYSTVTSDVREFLETAKKEKKVWDLVILDPPAFSNSHKAEDFDVQKDHVELLEKIYDVLSDGGVVLFSENLSGFRFEKAKIEAMYTSEEITSSLYAPNFSHKRRSCRIWILKRNSERKRERKEKKMSEELERFSLDQESAENGRKRERKEARSFSFDENEDSAKKDFSPRERKEEGTRRTDDRYGSRSRYEERRSGERRERYSSRYSDDRERPRYSDRNSRDDRKGGYRESRRDYRDTRDGYRDDRNGYRDNRGSRDRDERYSSSRYSDYSSPRDRYSDRREGRYGDERRSSYRRDGGDEWKRGRDYSKKEEHSSFARRSSDGSRTTYKRSSYSSDNRYEPRDDRRGREGRKKSSPKPFGYDSFMENKNRQGATADWLKEQEYTEKDND